MDLTSPTQQQTPDPQQLLNRIGNVLFDAVPDGWRRIDLRCRMVGRMQDFGLTVLMEDGSTPTIVTPVALIPLFTALRRATYQIPGPGTGAWFSARYTLDPPSRFHINYNFDHDPQGDPPIPTDEFRRDLDAFPRDDDHIPNWLRAKLGLAEANTNEPPAVLDPLQQDKVLQKITTLLVDAAPSEWLQIRMECRALGNYRELSSNLLIMGKSWSPSQGIVQDWVQWMPPQEIDHFLAELRAGMYEAGNTPATWFTARFRLDYPDRYNVQYDYDNEPNWQQQVPPGTYYDEWRMFPRSVNEAPSWLLSQVEKEAAAGGKLSLRQVNVYDDVDATGRPINNRPPVPEEEIPRLLDYLENAPVVLAARGFARDAFDPEGPGQVPLTFHTDGPLVWAGACAYYLRHYGLAPEPDLLTLARSCNFRPPTDVDDRTRNAAVALLTGQPRPIAPSQLSVSSRPQNAQTSTQPFGPLDDADPPLSLFKDRLIVEIPVGTEIDRFGNPSGCVTYEARTLYAHRSLPPDWLKNPYHIYRVVRSFRVLRGTAVSWFGQPGGGTAFVLPRAIEELLADNSLVEVMEDDKK